MLCAARASAALLSPSAERTPVRAQGIAPDALQLASFALSAANRCAGAVYGFSHLGIIDPRFLDFLLHADLPDLVKQSVAGQLLGRDRMASHCRPAPMWLRFSAALRMIIYGLILYRHVLCSLGHRRLGLREANLVRLRESLR